MEVATRRVHLAACTTSLGDPFMRQIARNLTDPFDRFLTGKRYVLMDRDANFSSAFRSALEEEGAVPVRLPPRSSNLTPHIERFHLSVKSEVSVHSDCSAHVWRGQGVLDERDSDQFGWGKSEGGGSPCQWAKSDS